MKIKDCLGKEDELDIGIGLSSRVRFVIVSGFAWLDRAAVTALRDALTRWLSTGRLTDGE